MCNPPVACRVAGTHLRRTPRPTSNPRATGPAVLGAVSRCRVSLATSTRSGICAGLCFSSSFMCGGHQDSVIPGRAPGCATGGLGM